MAREGYQLAGNAAEIYEAQKVPPLAHRSPWRRSMRSAPVPMTRSSMWPAGPASSPGWPGAGWGRGHGSSVSI